MGQYDILFEPVKIGPVVARNRFFQVPHCSGMPHFVPRGHAAMREVKAEGGWAVVSTEACSIHPTSDARPTPEELLWDDDDKSHLAMMIDAVHRHGALAAIEILHHGAAVANRYSREIPLSPRGGRLIRHRDPVQARQMDLGDIRAFRQWHRDAALRARDAGADIVYVYAGHEVSLPIQFLWRRFNDRADAYGGSFENRLRLLRELLEDTRDAVGDRCAVALRFAVDELLGEEGITCDGEGRDVVERLAEMPDLWDVTVAYWSNDSTTARFAEEGWQQPYVSFVKSLTSKPVVGTGRFTTPDRMAAMVRRGVLDFIGAARPSIADPFLPNKIAAGDLDSIRECIGCNMCVTGNNTAVPIRCTQNPTMGEEWRRGWHPERIAQKRSDDRILVVGAGPAGLECARALGARGYPVLLAEARETLGGRLVGESSLPGLSTWIRVRDYRQTQFLSMPNVEVYPASELSAEDVLEFEVPHVVLATGASWRRDGRGQSRLQPVEGWEQSHVLTPEDVMSGTPLSGPVVIFDDDHFYLGGVIAELAARSSENVTLVTPAAEASSWTFATLEQAKIQTRLLELGVRIVTHRTFVAVGSDEVETACIFTAKTERIAARSVVMITERKSNDGLYDELTDRAADWNNAGLRTVTRVGDCLAPATIAHAVHAGHRFAREFQEETAGGFARERMALPS